MSSRFFPLTFTLKFCKQAVLSFSEPEEPNVGIEHCAGGLLVRREPVGREQEERRTGVDDARGRVQQRGRIYISVAERRVDPHVVFGRRRGRDRGYRLAFPGMRRGLDRRTKGSPRRRGGTGCWRGANRMPSIFALIACWEKKVLRDGGNGLPALHRFGGQDDRTDAENAVDTVKAI